MFDYSKYAIQRIIKQQAIYNIGKQDTGIIKIAVFNLFNLTKNLNGNSLEIQRIASPNRISRYALSNR